MNKKLLRKQGEISWLIACVLCSLGVALSAKSNLGVSMVVAPSYVLHHYLKQFSSFFSFGNLEYIVQGLMIIALAIIVKKFKIKYVLAFVTSVIYGLMLDVWQKYVIGYEPFNELYLNIIMMAAGAVITSLAIALYLKSFMPQQGYDLFVYELYTTFDKKMSKVKWIYDIASLLTAIVLMLILFGTFDLSLVGIGTLILTFINTPMISGFGKLLDKFVDFSPLFPTLAEKVFDYKK